MSELQKFIDELHEAGWTSPNDAQHAKIAEFYKNWIVPQVYEVRRLKNGVKAIMDDCDSAIKLKHRGDWYIYLASGIGDQAAHILNHE
jgi:hypothetical protein